MTRNEMLSFRISVEFETKWSRADRLLIERTCGQIPRAGPITVLSTRCRARRLNPLYSEAHFRCESAKTR